MKLQKTQELGVMSQLLYASIVDIALVMNKTLKDALTACLVIMFLPKR